MPISLNFSKKIEYLLLLSKYEIFGGPVFPHIDRRVGWWALGKEMSTDDTKKTKGKVIPIKKRPKSKSLKKVNITRLSEFRALIDDAGDKVQGPKQPYQEVRDWEPTEADRQTVKMMTASGLRPQDIARVIYPHGPISASTVRRKFKNELRDGKIELIKDVAVTAHRMALSGKFPVMTIFWLKCIAGWDDGRRGGRGYDEEEDSKSVAKRLQTSAKHMYDTLPNPKSANSGDDG